MGENQAIKGDAPLKVRMKLRLNIKHLKRSTYFMSVAVLALLASGIVTFFIFQPVWKIAFSYQYIADKWGGGSLLLNDEENRGSTYSDKSLREATITQAEILQNGRFIENIADDLKKQGIKDWPIERITPSIKITHPVHSDLIEVEVQTPEKMMTLQIAFLLDHYYIAYLEDLQKDIIRKRQAFIKNSLNNAYKKLEAEDKKVALSGKEFKELKGETISPIGGDGRVRGNENAPSPTLGERAGVRGSGITNNPELEGELLKREFQDLSEKIRETESLIALDEATYSGYSNLLNRDEKSLIEGVIIGEDTVINRLSEQLASARADTNILPVKYGPSDEEHGEKGSQQVKSLEQLLEKERQNVLGEREGQESPVIRDSMRKSFIKELISSKIRLQASEKQHNTLIKQREELLARIDRISETSGDYNILSLQKNILHNNIASLEKQLTDLDYELNNFTLPVKLFQAIPKNPSRIQPVSHSLLFFLTAFSGLFCLLGAIPLFIDYRSSLISNQSMLEILKELLNAREQHVIVMLPVYSSGHLNASLHLGGLLNQFGKNSIVIDADLSNRMLSRKIHSEHTHGLFEHLLDSDMKKPYLDALSGAKVIPLETTISADKLVEFSQVVQRIPRLLERWPGSVVILDISQWHEAYHQLLPYVSQVVFYVPPSHKSSSALLPRVFKNKYHIPVSLVEIQPEL